jgi:hypothetical protein
MLTHLKPAHAWKGDVQEHRVRESRGRSDEIQRVLTIGL